MNFKYIILLSLMFIISIGSVSAVEDMNSTVETTGIMDDIQLDSVVMSGQIGASGNNEYIITNDNYGKYFDNQTGDILEDAPFDDGDVLKFDNISDKYFVISKNLTIKSLGSNTTLTNVGFNFVPGSEGSSVVGLTIENNAQKWVNNNQIQLIAILIQHTKNINVVNSYIHSSANHAFALADASYCNIRNNTLSTTTTSAPAGGGGKSTFLITVSSYNNITDNKMYSTSANIMYFLAAVPGVTLNNGISEFNLIKNNYLNGTTGMNSPMCYAINLMGNVNQGKSIGQNTFAGNVISNANIGINVQKDVKELIIINNTFINVKSGIAAGTDVIGGGIVVRSNSINATTTGVLFRKGYAIIENNTINAGGYGIQITQSANNVTVDDNMIISGKDYAISVAGAANVSVTNNYIISKDYCGNNAVTTTNNNTIINNNSPDGASIDVDIVANINENAIITINVLPFDANGNITIKFNGKTETISFNASQAIIYNLGVLGVGEYNVTIIYNGNDKYNATNITKTFSVGKISDYNMTLNNTEIIAGENSTIVIILPKDANGIAEITIGNNTFKANVTNGIANVEIDSLTVGNYEITVKYYGDDIYEDSQELFNLTVNPAEVNLNVTNVVMFYKDGTRLVAILTDINGNPIANATIYFTINGVTYSKPTNATGGASIALNLNAGIYDAFILFNGTDVYGKVSKNITVNIKSTIDANNIVKFYQNGTQFFATFIDSAGNVLANQNVTFNINGVFYTRKTNENGTARLAINLRPGEYILTAINPNTEQKGFNITVRSLIEADDLTKYFQNASRFEAKIYNKDGSLAVNKSVTFNINGVFYTRTTNNEGVVSLAINLRPGTYTITTMYDGLDMGNTVKVLPTLETKDLSMKFRDGSKFQAKTVDGQGKPLANQTVTFNVNGVFYHKVTDNEGIASLNINLNPGEYIITSIWNNYPVGNKITIA